MSNESHPVYREILYRAQRRHPDMTVSMAAIDHCDPLLLDAYRNRGWVKVRDQFGAWHYGWVGCSGGWWPTLLLMPRSASTGSSYTVNDHDEVVAIKKYGRYEPVSKRRSDGISA